MQPVTRPQALSALATAGVLWGTSVPLTTIALDGVAPGWLTAVRFALAAAVLLVLFRPRLRGVPPALVLGGALGYGGCIAVQNIGIAHTSITHAALLIGAVPVLVAAMAVVVNRARPGVAAWFGFALGLAGIALVAGNGDGSATLAGDALVLVSVVGGAAFTIVQARLLPGQDVVAVSAAQFLASAALMAPIAMFTEGVDLDVTHWGLSATTLLSVAGLVVLATALPYTLFSLGQTGVAPEVAGAFVNLETLVAALIGVAVFGEPVGAVQAVGVAALLAGIYLASARRSRSTRRTGFARRMRVALSRQAVRSTRVAAPAHLTLVPTPRPHRDAAEIEPLTSFRRAA